MLTAQTTDRHRQRKKLRLGEKAGEKKIKRVGSERTCKIESKE